MAKGSNEDVWWWLEPILLTELLGKPARRCTYVPLSRVPDHMLQAVVAAEDRLAIHGVFEAARAFFGMKVEALTLAQSALIAGIIPALSAYSPVCNPWNLLRGDLPFWEASRRADVDVGDRDLEDRSQQGTAEIAVALPLLARLLPPCHF